MVEVEKIILGIDPGTMVMGFGLVQQKGKQLSIIRMDVIKLNKLPNQAMKLKMIFEKMLELIDEYHPDELAIEAPFFGKNVQSMLKLGRAQGVAMAAAISRQVPIHEYAPMQIKMAITGNGSASKEQVAYMLRQMMKIPQDAMLPWLDATDGLAAAYCHFIESSRPVGPGGAKTWKEFVRKNKDKIHGI